MDISLREEKLGKALIEAYKGKMFPLQDSCYRFEVLFPHVIPLGFRNWHEFLFGSKHHEFEFESANFYLKKYGGVEIIDYASLDELDIQLTLMGMNVK